MALKEMVKNFGYDPDDLRDTPTECEVNDLLNI